MSTPTSYTKTLGKQIGESRYLHVTAFSALDSATLERITAAERLAGVERGVDYNLVRLDRDSGKIALLHYPHFFSIPFPALEERWLLHPEQGQCDYRTYRDSLNPPILHRKELMLAAEDPQRAKFAELTAAAEAAGLFADSKRIGYRRQWEHLIRERGYQLVGDQLLPLGNAAGEGTPEEGDAPHGWAAQRQSTALVRYAFSAPVQALARHGFLDGRYTFFDYGCGRGDDLRGLQESGITATGWDPFYAPDGEVVAADLVNLGFVLNVIEDFEERLEALTRAWSLARQVLVVSVMLVNQNAPRGEPFRDGVMTQRGTFQRYYTQGEMKHFLQEVLDREAFAVAPGIFYLFRDAGTQQAFLVRRSRSAPRLLRHSTPPLRERRAARGAVVVDAELEAAYRQRREDLLLFLALDHFARRRPYSRLEPGLRRDLKHFFGNYASAQAEGLALLLQIADVAAIAAACQQASEHGLGWLEREEGRGAVSLQLDATLVERLPLLLRVYVGAAVAAYGDVEGADLLKIHIGSGKLTLMRYDDFQGKALPQMLERVKITLREQDVELFCYGGVYTPPFLYRKSRFLSEEHPFFLEQLAFDEALEGLGWFDFSGYGPTPEALLEGLRRHRWEVAGWQLRRVSTFPDLDEPCGRFLTFRQLIECGETQAASGLANRPLEAESYTALLELAEQVLDPVIEWFGMIRLTYGFCSPALARMIRGRIDPKLDQHAAHERNRLGNRVCKRLGAAVDFYVEDEDMREVARWVAHHTPFDRLYFYGSELPIHVSFGPDHSRQVVTMRPGPSGRLVPRVGGL